jgi:hypothetical protein
MSWLRLEYTLSGEEVNEARVLALRHQLGGGSTWRTIAVLAVIIALSSGWFFLVVPRRFWLHLPAGFVAIWIIALIQQRSTASRAKNTVAHIDDEGIQWESSDASALMKWSMFGRLLESPSIFVLCDRNGTLLLAFPKRIFPDDHAREWFRARAEAAPHQVEADVIAVRGFPLDSAPATFSDIPPHSATDEGEAIALRFRYRFRDFMDRSLASWCSGRRRSRSVHSCTLWPIRIPTRGTSAQMRRCSSTSPFRSRW